MAFDAEPWSPPPDPPPPRGDDRVLLALLAVLVLLLLALPIMPAALTDAAHAFAHAPRAPR